MRFNVCHAIINGQISHSVSYITAVLHPTTIPHTINKSPYPTPSPNPYPYPNLQTRPTVLVPLPFLHIHGCIYSASQPPYRGSHPGHPRHCPLGTSCWKHPWKHSTLAVQYAGKPAWSYLSRGSVPTISRPRTKSRAESCAAGVMTGLASVLEAKRVRRRGLGPGWRSATDLQAQLGQKAGEEVGDLHGGGGREWNRVVGFVRSLVVAGSRPSATGLDHRQGLLRSLYSAARSWLAWGRYYSRPLLGRAAELIACLGPGIPKIIHAPNTQIKE